MIGRKIAHFEVVGKLGEGGMGAVYKAHDEHLDRFVALKVLPPDALADRDRRRRFVQEAKAASALNHPNIIHIYDIGEAETELFIAMEYVEGKTLGEVIQPRGLPFEEAIRYASQIADGLATAHAAGLVHRDLKPSNIMVTGQRTIKVLDFGLAKVVERAAVAPSDITATLAEGGARTAAGAILGTAAYMSPEQAEGKDLDGRSDVFSFGAVLYEMVTGRQAFQGDSAISILSAVLRDEPPRVNEIRKETPRELERIIVRCLRKDPARRFQRELSAGLSDQRH